MISKFCILLIGALYVATSTALPPCVCTREFKAVCGTDGKTYSNECVLNCARQNSNSELDIAKKGPCDKEEDCFCTFEYRPVCGADGITYGNPCAAECKKVEVKSFGNCDQVKVVEIPPCTCTKEKKPVCGTDGATYSNACILNCATAANSRLGISHTGPCEEKVEKPEVSHDAVCSCTRNLAPVCSSDGVTYNNECLLGCTGKSKLKDGACEEVNFVSN